MKSNFYKKMMHLFNFIDRIAFILQAKCLTLISAVCSAKTSLIRLADQRMNDLSGSLSRAAAPSEGPCIESELLVCCARTRMDDGTAARIKTLVLADIDWANLLRTALSHGIMPLLYWHLRNICIESIPPNTLNELQDRFDANTRRTHYLTTELLQILKLLESNAIPALPFKGPALATTAYGSVSLRQFLDLDILVRRRHIMRTRVLLVRRGYQPALELTPPQERLLIESQGELELVRHSDGCIVDLHWDISQRYLSLSHDIDELWKSADQTLVNSTMVSTLSRELLLVALCVHATKHSWSKLGYVCDVAEVALSPPGIDWDRALQHARNAGGERMLLLGVLLASELLGAPLPSQVVCRARETPPVAVLAGRLREAFFREGQDCGSALPTPMYSAFHFLVRERPRDKFHHFLRVVFALTEEDLLAVPLPRCVSFLYYIVRLVRLIRVYSWTLITYVIWRKSMLHPSSEQRDPWSV